MTAARSVTATFNAVPVNYTLSVSKSGSGTVSGTGISCGTTCSASYASGTNVTLTATPAAGYTFGGWGGACAGSTCTVSMTKAQSVSATFNADSGSAKPSVVFSSNPTQYQRVTATISWGPGTIPSTAAMALNDANLLTFTTTNRTTTAVFMPQLAGAKSWVLKSRSGSDGPVLTSGAITVAVAPPFPVQADTPAYAANPGGRGYCKPQCAEFVQAQLGLPGGRGYAKNFWTNPYTQQGYINQAQGQSTRPPRPGDMLVWSGTLNPGCGENGSGCGHVAIVKSVDLASGTLVRVDANWSAQWQTDCRVRETAMTVTRDPTTGAYTIGGTNSNHLFGWQSKD